MEEPHNELHTHIASLRRYAIALVGNPTDADDLVQETLEKAITYVQKGGKIGNMRGYLFAILRNSRISHLRCPANRASHVSFDEVAGGFTVAANQHQRAELQALLREVNNLREEQRQVILLVCVEGLTYREAAAVIGVPMGTVMSRLARARQALIERTTAEIPGDSKLRSVA